MSGTGGLPQPQGDWPGTFDGAVPPPPPPPGAPLPTSPSVPPPGLPPSGRIEIAEADLYTPAVEERANRMREAVTPKLVREVGDPVLPSSKWGSVGPLVAAGSIGGFLGWGASELIVQTYRSEQAFIECFENLTFSNPACSYEPWYGTSPTIHSIMFVGTFALVLGAVIAGWDGIAARSSAKFWSLVLRALPLLGVAGVVGGWFAQEIFQSLVADATSASDYHLPRAMAWAVFGVGVGAALGASSRSANRALNGALGGAIGGFIGGFIFDFIDLSSSTGVPNRVVGLSITGIAIGLAIGLVEAARRDHWLEIVSGGMAGKQFILYNDTTAVGSGHTCDVTLIKDPGISAEHARLTRRGDGLVISGAYVGAPIMVNGTEVAEAPLNEGDLIQLGSTVLRYRSKDVMVPTGPVPGPYYPSGNPLR